MLSSARAIHGYGEAVAECQAHSPPLAMMDFITYRELNERSTWLPGGPVYVSGKQASSLSTGHGTMSRLI